jgi:hypothetical protein
MFLHNSGNRRHGFEANRNHCCRCASFQIPALCSLRLLPPYPPRVFTAAISFGDATLSVFCNTAVNFSLTHRSCCLLLTSSTVARASASVDGGLEFERLPDFAV